MKKISVLTILFFLAIQLFAKEEFPRENNVQRVMSFNIRTGRGMDNVFNLERTAAAINRVKPDIVALQEVDNGTKRVNKMDLAVELGKQTLMHSYFAKAISHDGGEYGVAVLSKAPAISVEKLALPGREEKRTLLMVEFENYIFFSTHFSLTQEDRLSSAKIINDYAAKAEKPVILAGDLNAAPDSETMKLFFKDWKKLSNTGQATYPAKSPTDVIDYILAYQPNEDNKNYAVITNRVLNDSISSDHRPIFADVRLKAKTEDIMRTVPYLQNPATNEMTVMWHTNVPSYSWIEYGTDSVTTSLARTIDEGMTIANNTTNRIKLENLKPATKYYYRVCSQEITKYRSYSKEFGETAKSEFYSFTTFDDKSTDFKAIIFNDLHEVYSTFDKLAAQVRDLDYDLVFYNGDCISDIETEEQIMRSLNHYTKGMKGSEIPALYIRGNHEIRGQYSAELWNYVSKLFGEHTYGAFSFGDTRFVVLDAGEDKDDDHWVYYGLNDFTQYRVDQKEFIKKEIASPEFKKAQRKVLVHHIPLFGKGMEGEKNHSKALWEAELAKGDFAIALNGHTHRHEYVKKGAEGNTYPLVIGGGYNPKGATVYVLEKTGKKLNLKVLNVEGEIVQELDL